jgi:hypothetical protein
MSLYGLFLNNAGPPIHKAGHYFFAYQRHFARFVGTPVTFLEFGAHSPGSALMWKAWLGPLARVIFVTPERECGQELDEQVSVRVGRQDDRAFLDALLQEFGAIDVVLDDGSHRMPDVVATFNYLYDKISPSGVYMIEDMHTAYWPDYGGGRGDPRSIVERFKGMIDDLNAEHVRDGTVYPSRFTQQTLAMTAYDSVLVFEKSATINKYMYNIGK